MEDDSGLLNIEISSSDEATMPLKPSRDYQSEENFQKQKLDWKPNIENGEIWKSLNLPVNNPSKPEAQTILHAVEELYFFRRYDDSERIVRKALEGELQDDFRRTLEDYLGRCIAKLAATSS